LILLVAVINYVNLMTARSGRRAVEVGVRKVAGASRTHLAFQFIGESALFSVLGLLVALMLVELLLPHLNGFLDRDLSAEWPSVPWLAILLVFALIVGVLAGVYPALVLSAFRPMSVLKSGTVTSVGAGVLRHVLVLAQFSVLVGLVLVTGVIHLQTTSALRQGLRFNHDQLLAIRVPPESCEHSVFTTAVQALPGVSGAACSSDFLINYQTHQYRTSGGRELTLEKTQVAPGLFELIGLKPAAGRFFAKDRAADVTPSDPRDRNVAMTYRTVINESAARALGYSRAADAVGTVFTSLSDLPQGTRREVIGVVPDFARESVRAPIGPMFYDNGDWFDQLSVRLRGNDVPRTLQAIDRLWQRAGLAPYPISRRFYDEYVESLYRDLERQRTLFSGFAVLALVLAAMGLFGLAAFTAERRTREIGIRKALGADSSDVTRLLLWQFAKPVLAANLIAWPLAAWLMSRWLNGFAYRIELPIWLFPVTGLGVLAIALLTVFAHSTRVGRARAVEALRYE
jgi:putative ABC transport system permease protein